MKKLIIIAVVVALAVLFVIPASLFAHPVVPAQSVGNVPDVAAAGLHKACSNLDPGGIAYHNMFYRLSPHAD